MHKTPFSKKCEILGSLWVAYKDEAEKLEGWKQFFSWSDVALPMAYMVWLDMVSLKEDSPSNPKLFIEESWEELCKILEKNPDESYESIEELLP